VDLKVAALKERFISTQRIGRKRSDEITSPKERWYLDEWVTAIGGHYPQGRGIYLDRWV
jgi:hypothetical protein